MVDTNIVYATDTYVNFLKFLHVLRGMISDDRARTKYKYMEYASMKICYFRVRHVRTYTICQALHLQSKLECNNVTKNPAEKETRQTEWYKGTK